MSKYNTELDLNTKNGLSLLIQRIKPNSKVLEFGPANGRMTKYLKEKLNCKVYAVEIDEESAKDAAQYTEDILVDSIENYSWKQKFQNIRFDYIIFADVLEHLYCPEKVLKNTKDFLKHEGRVLISIPNIAHNAIILGLMKNEFNYSATGLLDDTHIRFYTKKTFDALIEKTGYYIAYESAIYEKPENTELSNRYNEVPKELGHYLSQQPYGEIYQLIYELSKHQVEYCSDLLKNNQSLSLKFIQLFINEGQGYSEQNSIKQYIETTQGVNKYIFDLNAHEKITSLRLDPSNDYTVTRISSLEVNGKAIDLESLSSNAVWKKDYTYYFDTQDPQIHITNITGQEVHQVTIEIEYLFMDIEALKSIQEATKTLLVQANKNIKNKDAQLVQANENIKNKETQLAVRNQKINQIQGHIDALQKELTGIYASKSWMITGLLRKLKKLLNRK